MPKHSFEAFNVALALIRSLRPVLAKLRSRDKKLAQQIEDAANSVGLNLCQGRRRVGRDRLHLWRRLAGGSADEVRGGLYLAEAWGHICAEEVLPSLALNDHLLALTWNLTH